MVSMPASTSAGGPASIQTGAATVSAGKSFSYGRRKRVREISGVRDGLKRESICRNHCSIVDGAAGTTV